MGPVVAGVTVTGRGGQHPVISPFFSLVMGWLWVLPVAAKMWPGAQVGANSPPKNFYLSSL